MLGIFLNHLNEKEVPAGTSLLADVEFEPGSEVVGGAQAGAIAGKDSFAQNV